MATADDKYHTLPKGIFVLSALNKNVIEKVKEHQLKYL